MKIESPWLRIEVDFLKETYRDILRFIPPELSGRLVCMMNYDQ